MAIKRRTKRVSGPPKVGIFWVLGTRIFIDATPVAAAANHADFKIHDWGHDSVWKTFQKANPELCQLEYDEVPRGRVMYNPNIDQYLLLADRCILQNSRLVNQIRAKMDLSRENMKVDSDLHYRCPKCLNVGF